jgi:hypothetical protein
MKKTYKMWAIIEEEGINDIPIPCIPRKIGGEELKPSCIFVMKADALLAKELGQKKLYKEIKIKVVPCEVKLLTK